LNNAQKEIVLEDRLIILDKLDALFESNPDAQQYRLSLGDFRLTGEPADARNHFAWLQNRGVASFIFTDGTNDWNFWEMPFRIKGIDRAQLAKEQDDTRARLRQLEPATVDPTRVDTTGNGPAARERPPSPKGELWASKAIRITVAIVGFLASVAIVWGFIASNPW
jgi:hypothetical protein